MLAVRSSILTVRRVLSVSVRRIGGVGTVRLSTGITDCLIRLRVVRGRLVLVVLSANRWRVLGVRVLITEVLVVGRVLLCVRVRVGRVRVVGVRVRQVVAVRC